MKKKILMSLFTIAIIGALITGGVMAVFTDTGTVGQNTFTTGTVDITLNGVDNATAIFILGNMTPGDSVTGTVTVANGGTLDLRYAMTTTPGGANPYLAGQLQAVITWVATSDILYSGPLSGASFGNPAQGFQQGDKFLAVAGSEVLSFTVTLPLATATSWQGKSCTATFTFFAEQAQNNL